MGCGNCATQEGQQPKGCNNNGSCGTDGCNKLAVFDWLSNMILPNHQEQFNIVEIRFKNGRKHFYKNTKGLSICMGETVTVEASPGHDVGVISLVGELVKIQLKKKNLIPDSEDIKQIYRKASTRDIEIWQASRNREIEVQKKSRLIILRLGLKMKLSDVEFQGDGSKATFYYTADDRVDFRMLIRELASSFSIRVEMRQVGLRQEAARLGGVGSCGRELCCSTWLTDFRSVTTSAARYQQLSLNPQKLAGQCGKLKCCLNYELDSYLEALKVFPRTDVILKTEKGDAIFQKMDIFKGMIWYAYKDNPINWHPIKVQHATKIIELNKADKFNFSLEDFSFDFEDKALAFADLVSQESLTRFDKPKHNKKKRRNKKRKRNAN